MFKKIFFVAVLLMAGGLFCANSAVSQPAKPVKTDTLPELPAGDDMSAPTSSVGGGTTVDEKVSKEDKDPKAKDLYTQVELFSYTMSTVLSEYVDEKTPKQVIYGALEGMLAALDPHSQFLPPDDYKDLKTETEGKFGGLGIEITTRDGMVTIVTPIEDTPAWKAGIKAGDRIVKIEKKLTRDMSLNDAVKMLRGDPGTKVHITIYRELDGKTHEYDLVREVIHVQDVKEPRIIEDNIAYVRLVEFREDSYEQLYKEVKGLKDKGATALIFDLRNNPGGLLNVAIKIAEMFLPEGKTIVSTKGRHESQDSLSISHNKKNEFSDWPIVLLINEGSASGSEIVAGALKDNKRAVTLGAKSFGKGSVQSVIPLPDGSGLRLTTAKYFTPSGVCIHEIGITPDIVVERIHVKAKIVDEPQGDEELNDGRKAPAGIFDKMEEDAIADPNEKVKHRNEADFKERMALDNQVQSAISVIKGIRVYKKLGQ